MNAREVFSHMENAACRGLESLPISTGGRWGGGHHGSFFFFHSATVAFYILQCLIDSLSFFLWWRVLDIVGGKDPLLTRLSWIDDTTCKPIQCFHEGRLFRPRELEGPTLKPISGTCVKILKIGLTFQSTMFLTMICLEHVWTRPFLPIPFPPSPDMSCLCDLQT